MGSTFRMKSAHQADLKGKGILYEDDDEPVKLIDRDDSFVIKEQPTLERADVFTRMQLPVRHNGRDNQSNVHRHHQPSLEIREPHSRTYAEYMPRRDLGTNLREGNDRQSRSWDDNRRLGSHADRRMGTHADRIIRRRDDYKRSDIYGGGRARAGPYDRRKEVSWRPKQRLPEVNGKEQRGDASNNEIVPYEHISGAGSLDSPTHFKDADAGISRKLASAIVTPSRLDRVMEDNVTVRSRSMGSGDGKALTFSPQKDEATVRRLSYDLSAFHPLCRRVKRVKTAVLGSRTESCFRVCNEGVNAFLFVTTASVWTFMEVLLGHNEVVSQPYPEESMFQRLKLSFGQPDNDISRSETGASLVYYYHGAFLWAYVSGDIFVFRQFVYQSCFSDLENFWDDLPVSRLKVVWKSSGLLGSLLTKSSGLPGSRLDFQEVVWTSRKSSGLPESRLDFSERFGFYDLEDFWDDLPVSRLEVVWTS
ncbi:hypothetical protein YC2023_107348 [Brassica napus]